MESFPLRYFFQAQHFLHVLCAATSVIREVLLIHFGGHRPAVFVSLRQALNYRDEHMSIKHYKLFYHFNSLAVLYAQRR